MIKEFEFYHGVVLSRLVHDTRNFGVSVRPYPTGGNAAYIIDERVGVYIKYSSKRMSPWQFTFQKIHQKEFLLMNEELDSFLVLVCGDDGLVVLSFEEVKMVIRENLQSKWIRASRAPRKEYSIKGSDGILKHKFGKNDFPRKLFDTLV